MIGGDCTSPPWLAGGGEMGARMRAKDWSATPLGHPKTWSRSIQTAGLPVIVVTGYGNREELIDFGEARILQKPYTEGELMEKIAEALN
jgi:CheY-like chemotaxis protein